MRRKRAKPVPTEIVAAEQAFQAVLAVLEPAKAGLADVLPTTRMPGRPLSDALAAFLDAVDRVCGLMSAWRIEQLETHWVACDEGLRRSRGAAARISAEAPEIIGFEGLLGVITGLLDPLEPFQDAERAFRTVRRRRRSD